MTRLTYACEACGKPVANDDGHLVVSYRDIYEFERASKEWERAHALYAPDGKQIGTISSGEDFDSYPEPAHWSVRHNSCLDGVVNPYYVPVDSLRTCAGVLSVVAHLLGKRWVQSTNLDEWIYSHALTKETVAS